MINQTFGKTFIAQQIQTNKLQMLGATTNTCTNNKQQPINDNITNTQPVSDVGHKFTNACLFLFFCKPPHCLDQLSSGKCRITPTLEKSAVYNRQTITWPIIIKSVFVEQRKNVMYLNGFLQPYQINMVLKGPIGPQTPQ